jgi:hypothetical protein
MHENAVSGGIIDHVGESGEVEVKVSWRIVEAVTLTGDDLGGKRMNVAHVS